MNSQFKPNNVFAILIAVALMATGFVLSFINKQATTEQDLATADEAQKVTSTDQAAPVDADPETAAPREDNGDL